MGQDIKAFIPKPLPEKQKESAKNYLDEVFKMVLDQEKSFKWLKWVPFKFVPKKKKELWTRQAFNLSFRTAALLLGSKGVYVSKKKDIVSAFKRYTREKELCDMISYTFSLWKKWGKEPLNNKETKQLLENSFRFVKGLQSLQ